MEKATHHARVERLTWKGRLTMDTNSKLRKKERIEWRNAMKEKMIHRFVRLFWRWPGSCDRACRARPSSRSYGILRRFSVVRIHVPAVHELRTNWPISSATVYRTFPSSARNEKLTICNCWIASRLGNFEKILPVGSWPTVCAGMVTGRPALLAVDLNRLIYATWPATCTESLGVKEKGIFLFEIASNSTNQDDSLMKRVKYLAILSAFDALDVLLFPERFGFESPDSGQVVG